ncbi:hypothetical protein TRVA0_032S00386 [Trichomonascus vanleenenianus]|uniref:SUMO protease ULP2 n=1 Tax=Trichomonascus vanleenenianus TaxID=2268995 RepID=UPI003ECB04AA
MADRNGGTPNEQPRLTAGRKIKDASRMNSIKRGPSISWIDSAAEIRSPQTYGHSVQRKRPLGGLSGFTPTNNLRTGPAPAPQRPPSEMMRQPAPIQIQDQIAIFKRRKHDREVKSSVRRESEVASSRGNDLRRQQPLKKVVRPIQREPMILSPALEIATGGVPLKKRFTVDKLNHGGLYLQKIDLHLDWEEEKSSKFSLRVVSNEVSIEMVQEEILSLVVCFETHELAVRFKKDRRIECKGEEYYAPCMLMKISKLKDMQQWFNLVKSEPGVGISIERANSEQMDEIHKEIAVRAKRQGAMQQPLKLSLDNDTLVLENRHHQKPIKNDITVNPHKKKLTDNDASFASRIYNSERTEPRLQSVFSPVEKDKYYDTKHLRRRSSHDIHKFTDEEANKKLRDDLEGQKSGESRLADRITQKPEDTSNTDRSLNDSNAQRSSLESNLRTPTGNTELKSTTENGLFAGKSPELRRSTRQTTKPIEQQALEEDPERLARMRERNKKMFPSPLQYKFADNKSVEITLDDFNRLDEGEFLNDTMINFFFKLVVQNQSNLDGNVHLFNTYFYERLRTSGYEGVKNWTSKTDIFSMKYVIVPIHAKLHWYLAVIYNLPSLLEKRYEIEEDSDVEMTETTAAVDDISLIKSTTASKEIPVRITRSGKEASTANNTSPRATLDPRHAPCIFVLDSLRAHTGSSGPQRILKEYIVNEAREKKGIEITRDMIFGFNPYSPQQPNYCDCGVYIVHYLQRFLRLPERFAQLMIDFRNPKAKEELKLLWREDRLGNKRGKLRDWILEMRKQLTGENSSSHRITAVDDDDLNGSDDEDILEIMAFDKDSTPPPPAPASK